MMSVPKIEGGSGLAVRDYLLVGLMVRHSVGQLTVKTLRLLHSLSRNACIACGPNIAYTYIRGSRHLNVAIVVYKQRLMFVGCH